MPRQGKEEANMTRHQGKKVTNHPLQEGHQPEGGVQSCGPSMHEWIPGPISQASQGGTYPIKESKEIDNNLTLLMRMKEGLEPGGKKRGQRQE